MTKSPGRGPAPTAPTVTWPWGRVAGDDKVAGEDKLAGNDEVAGDDKVAWNDKVTTTLPPSPCRFLQGPARALSRKMTKCQSE